MATSPDPSALTNGAAPQDPAGGSTPPAPETPPAPQSVEEVEAMWQNRFSQRDRAHNAEVASLQAQLTALKTIATPAVPPADGSNPDAGYKQRYEQSQRELETERQARTIDQRRAQYTALAGETKPDDPIWATGPDETLARLNALISGPPAPAQQPSGPIDPNNPRRGAPVQGRQYEEMTKDELLGELRRMAPGEQERLASLR